MKKLVSILIVLAMVLSFAACGSEPAADGKYTVGICQLVQHEALDAATEGFKAALTEKLGDDVAFVEHNASGDAATCITICNQLVSEGVNLIMGNATPALQAAAAATSDIPVIGTSITDYATALEIADWTGATGSNITGTADLAPLDQQGQMILDILPDAKKVGLLYCSAEPNSVYQVEKVKEFLDGKGITTTVYTFSDSSDVALVAQKAAEENDALYVPTDNTAASCAETIGNIVREKKNIKATEVGINLIHTIISPLLKSAELTGLWEKKLREIERGDFQAQQFLDELKQMTAEVVREVKSDKSGMRCPICGKGMIIRGRTRYGCSRWREGCTYAEPF